MRRAAGGLLALALSALAPGHTAAEEIHEMFEARSGGCHGRLDADEAALMTDALTRIGPRRRLIRLP